MVKKVAIWLLICVGSAGLTIGALKAVNDTVDLRAKLGLGRP